MYRRGGMLTACATIVYLLMFHGASSSDANSDSTAACRQLCSEEDRGHVDAPSVDRCALTCQRMARLGLENRLRTQEKLSEDPEENFSRSGRAWFYPRASKWRARKLTSGIGSRSRSAGAFLRIGRYSGNTSPSLESVATGPASVDRRAPRMRFAGRYLRIGRADESAEPEMMASDAVHDGKSEEDLADVLQLRKVNR